MNDKTISAEKADPAKKAGAVQKRGTTRQDRLAEQLRANLQKRKAQSRSRRTGDADERPDGLAAAKDLQKD